MLVIRLQRTGRKGHAQFRIVVQDSRRTPTSGAIVASLGSYNPHTKAIVLDKEKAAKYLNNGAQPSNKVIYLLQTEKVALPKWVKLPAGDKKTEVRNPEKRRSTRPEEPTEAAPAEEAAAPSEETDAPSEEQPVEVAEAQEGATPEADEAKKAE